MSEPTTAVLDVDAIETSEGFAVEKLLAADIKAVRPRRSRDRG